MQDWDIKPRGNICTKCQAVFADKQPYFSMLQPGQEKFERQDYCEACWPEIKRGDLPYSMWRGVYRMPPPVAEEPLKKETAESLLRKLIEEADPAQKNVIFILAVMLERKKIIVERDFRKNEDGSWTRVYEHRKTGETFLIADPRLTLNELEKVQVEVITLLGGKPPSSVQGKEEQTAGTVVKDEGLDAEAEAQDDSVDDDETEEEDEYDDDDEEDEFDDDDEDDDEEDEEEDGEER